MAITTSCIDRTDYTRTQAKKINLRKPTRLDVTVATQLAAYRKE